MCNKNTRERKKGIAEICEAIITENFPKLMSDTKSQIQEAKRIPSMMNAQDILWG